MMTDGQSESVGPMPSVWAVCLSALLRASCSQLVVVDYIKAQSWLHVACTLASRLYCPVLVPVSHIIMTPSFWYPRPF